MFEVNGLQIQAEGIDILEEMKSQLASNGINLFHTIKPGTNNIQFSCPVHKDGQERKPSCGMSLITTYKGGRVIPAGTVHCFTCGYTQSLTEFISTCFGKQDGGRFGNNWLKRNFTSNVVVNRPAITLNLQRGNNIPPKEEKVVIPENVLDSYRYVHDYMYKRKLTDDIIELFDVGYDRKRQCLTFPVKDMDGDVIFVQTRSVNTKFHHYSEGVDKTDYLYGAYECQQYYPEANEVWVCESIINALTLWTLGIPAIALMGVGGGHQFELLKQLPYRSLVLALDPDEPGQIATNKLIRILRGKKLLYTVEYLNDKDDVNDLGDKVLELNKILV